MERGTGGTLIHISMTAPLDLLTFGRYNFAAIDTVNYQKVGNDDCI